MSPKEHIKHASLPWSWSFCDTLGQKKVIHVNIFPPFFLVLTLQSNPKNNDWLVANMGEVMNILTNSSAVATKEQVLLNLRVSISVCVHHDKFGLRHPNEFMPRSLSWTLYILVHLDKLRSLDVSSSTILNGLLLLSLLLLLGLSFPSVR